MQTISTSFAWLPMSRDSMLPAFISALFNFKDLLLAPLFASTKMFSPLQPIFTSFLKTLRFSLFSYHSLSTRSSFFYQPWALCDPASHSAADDTASSQSPALVLVTPSLACRAQLLPLISRKIGTLFQFAFHDIGQLLCSFYSGCVPVEIMTETRALLYGQKVCPPLRFPRE
jgi:hypothetical protein